MQPALTDTAPIALFLYNRSWHTEQTLAALRRNTLAERSDLYVFLDGPKSDADTEAVAEVRAIANNIQGFRKVRLTDRGTNFGLARNIVEGVTEVLQDHETIIVLEDDIVTSPAFLVFMNNALERYADEQSVWHISGFNEALDNAEGDTDVFLWRMMNCWGWATWQDRWRHFDRNPEGLVKQFDKDMIDAFNLDGAHHFWSQVTENAAGRMNTWAVFWYATIFLNRGLCLNPVHSYVRNIGFDASGTHGDADSVRNDARPLNQSLEANYPDVIEEDEAVVARIKAVYARQKRPLRRRVFGRLQRLVRG